jgi:hypothetical protein
MPEIWGFCDACAQWFPCPDWFNRSVAEVVCPGCQAEPRKIVNRAAQPAFSQQLDDC